MSYYNMSTYYNMSYSVMGTRNTNTSLIASDVQEFCNGAGEELHIPL